MSFAMPMSTPMAIAVFFTIWWIVLFTVLPFGVRSQAEDGERLLGTDPGAPVAPLLLKKALWTTGLSVIVFVCLMVYMNAG